MLGGMSSVPSGGGVPNGAPRKMHAFCGVPGEEGSVLPVKPSGGKNAGRRRSPQTVKIIDMLI